MSTFLGMKGPKQNLIQSTKLIMELSKKVYACNFKIEKAEKGRYMLEARLSPTFQNPISILIKKYKTNRTNRRKPK